MDFQYAVHVLGIHLGPIRIVGQGETALETAIAPLRPMLFLALLFFLALAFAGLSLLVVMIVTVVPSCRNITFVRLGRRDRDDGPHVHPSERARIFSSQALGR